MVPACAFELYGERALAGVAANDIEGGARQLPESSQEPTFRRFASIICATHMRSPAHQGDGSPRRLALPAAADGTTSCRQWLPPGRWARLGLRRRHRVP